MRNCKDPQQSTLIGVIAKIPVPEARKIMLGKIERRLPRVGAVTDEQFGEIVNSALASFPPGQYIATEQGWRDRSAPHTSLKEAADAYVRMLRSDGTERTWPPVHPISVEQRMASAARVAERMRNSTPQELREAANAYIRFHGGAPREEPEIVEIVWDPAQPPPARPPELIKQPSLVDRVDALPLDPSEYSVAPTEEDLRARMPKPDQSDDDGEHMSPMAVATELSKRRKRGGLARKLRDSVKVFLR